jgi:tripartite-type tricarboxylate transporter receptor subunit TctC
MTDRRVGTPRRQTPAALLCLACVCIAAAAAAEYPYKPIRLILGTGAGASPDTTARIFAARMSEILGQQVIVDNRPGAGGIIGMEVVARATPDGYTLYACSIGQAIRPAMHKKLPFDSIRDFTRISMYGAVPNVLIVHSSVPARTLSEFVSYAKANPGKMKYASSGIGLSPHLTMEYFKTLAGIDLLHVPYKAGAQAITDVLAGQVQTQFSNFPSQLPNIRSGKVRAIALTALKRHEQLPDVPTFDESGYPGFEVTVWYGMCGPAHLAKDAAVRLEAAAAKALSSPDLLQRYFDQGVEPRAWAGEKFEAFYKGEIARWAKVAREAGIKPE